MLYLSRMDPSRDPKKTKAEASEEVKRRSIAQLGATDGADVATEEQVRRPPPPGGNEHLNPCLPPLGDASVAPFLWERGTKSGVLSKEGTGAGNSVVRVTLAPP